MDIVGIVGIVVAIVLMVFGVVYSPENGVVIANLNNFISYSSLAITIGGTFAVMMISYPGENFKRMAKHMKIIFMPVKYDPKEYIATIADFAKEARVKGLLSLEGKLVDVKDEFLKKSLMLVVDSVEAEKVKTILDTELDYLEERHFADIEFYQKGATFAPAFGMIGTLIGLVNMLQQMSDPDSIGPAMAVALLTTLYGSLLANVFFMPIANKLKVRHDEEMSVKILIAEGVKSIQAGENPRYIEEKLLLVLESSARATQEAGETKKKTKKAKAKG
ncbi:MAG: motility protein A [Erysipelotrichaceae bacterium]